MRTFLLSFLVWAIFAVFARWYYVCQIKHLCAETPVAVVDANARAKTLSLKDGGTNVLQVLYDQFRFNGDVPDLNDNNYKFLEETAKWLKANPDRKLTITGQFLESEKDISAGIYENLGLARAAKMQQMLEKLGVPKNQMSLDYRMVGGGALNEPVLFSLDGGALPDNYNKDEKLTTASFTFDNMTYSDANFEYDSDVFKPGTAFTAYADSVKTYLTLNANKSLNIIGHTDNVGSTDYNQKLGLRRAASTKKYFEKIGVKNKITIASKGKEEPIATNTTEEGRQKNRRVNVQIK
jgi:OOP family OmpA-OmpF porin